MGYDGLKRLEYLSDQPSQQVTRPVATISASAVQSTLRYGRINPACFQHKIKEMKRI